ncbi:MULTISPECIES: diaminopimelate epimerase [unclassified Streptomyces]|uniref:diaminopimelate epimerase n=1 Tax=unclassified Streptomyces TaxID=2593676 RepID=UPI00336A4A36
MTENSDPLFLEFREQLTDSLLPGLRKGALLEGNGNVIAVLELAGHHDEPLDVQAKATVALSEAVRQCRVDGVLFFYPDHLSGRRMVFFDRDGTWEATCGNGLRCVTRYASDAGLLEATGTIVTDDGPKTVRMLDGRAEVTLGRSREVQQLDDDRWFLYNGVPHLVVFVPDVSAIDVRTEGARLRYDDGLCRALGRPEGVHVNYVQVVGDRLCVRTYEVGVEDETQCCGTGAAASAVLSRYAGRSALPVTVQTLGGELTVAERHGEVSICGRTAYLVRPVGVRSATGSGDPR